MQNNNLKKQNLLEKIELNPQKVVKLVEFYQKDFENFNILKNKCFLFENKNLVYAKDDFKIVFNLPCKVEKYTFSFNKFSINKWKHKANLQILAEHNAFQIYVNNELVCKADYSKLNCFNDSILKIENDKILLNLPEGEFEINDQLMLNCSKSFKFYCFKNSDKLCYVLQSKFFDDFKLTSYDLEGNKLKSLNANFSLHTYLTENFNLGLSKVFYAQKNSELKDCPIFYLAKKVLCDIIFIDNTKLCTQNLILLSEKQQNVADKLANYRIFDIKNARQTSKDCLSQKWIKAKYIEKINVNIIFLNSSLKNSCKLPKFVLK